MKNTRYWKRKWKKWGQNWDLIGCKLKRSRVKATTPIWVANLAVTKVRRLQNCYICVQVEILYRLQLVQLWWASYNLNNQCVEVATCIVEITTGSFLSVPKFQPSVYKSSKQSYSFAFDAPTLRNALPDDIRAAPSLGTFRKRLKTYLYNKAYPL